MLEGDSADKCTEKCPLMTMGGQAEGLSCADPGARTPIGVSGNLITFSFTMSFFNILRFNCILNILSFVIHINVFVVINSLDNVLWWFEQTNHLGRSPSPRPPVRPMSEVYSFCRASPPFPAWFACHILSVWLPYLHDMYALFDLHDFHSLHYQCDMFNLHEFWCCFRVFF